jgi:CHAT domain-containing protein/tetratricopeptide (TPR) repeat protein
MRRLVCLALSLVVLGLSGTYGQAAKRVKGPTPEIEPASGPVKAPPEVEGGEAKALIAQARGLVKAGKFEEALPLAQQALERREKALGPDRPEVAGPLMLLGAIHYGMFNYYQALPLYKRALKIRERTLGPDHPDTVTSMARLAACYQLLGYPNQALPLAQRSLKMREAKPETENLDTAQSLSTLAFVYAQMGAHNQALPLAQRSLAIREKAVGADQLETARGLDNLAMVYTQMGQLSQALPLAQRAVAIREKVQGLDHRETALSLRSLGFIYLLQKNYAQAEACFRRAQFKMGDQGMMELYLATGRYEAAVSLLPALAPGAAARPQYLAQFYTQKGQALMGTGAPAGAAEAFLAAVNAIEELRARTPGERTSFFETGLISPYFRAYRGMVTALAAMALKKDSLPSAFKGYGADPAAAAFYFAEAIKGRALLEAMAAGAAKVSPQLPGDLAVREHRLRERLEALEAQREDDFGVHKGRKRDIADFQVKMEALRKDQQSLVEDLRRHFPRYAALQYPQPYKAQELPLKPGEVILEYVLGEKESYLFRVEPGGKTQVFRLAQAQESLEKRLGATLAPFRQSVLRREDLPRFSLTEAAALYQELLAPALSGVVPGTHLIIVPDGILGAFPFEALVVQAGADWRTSSLVGDRWPVTYSQSAAILALNRHLGASHASQPFFALADCIYEKGSPRYMAFKSGQGQAGELKETGGEKAMSMAATGREWGRLEFPPLPETRQTAVDLAALFQVKAQAPQVLMDVQATESRLRQAPLGQYRYLFFGTHGFLADKLSGVQEPTLVLTQVENKAPDNGFLTFSKVLQLKLDAEVVTLAACMTGVGQVTQGEGVLNFARAFQQAGARSVMVSLWNIPVAESLKFYHLFYQGLKEGKTRLEALKAARQAVRAQEAHPYFWSGLILHGEG